MDNIENKNVENWVVKNKNVYRDVIWCEVVDDVACFEYIN